MDFILVCPPVLQPSAPVKVDAEVATNEDLTISQLFELKTIEKGSLVDKLYTHLTNIKLNGGKSVECYTGKKVSSN